MVKNKYRINPEKIKGANGMRSFIDFERNISKKIAANVQTTIPRNVEYKAHSIPDIKPIELTSFTSPMPSPPLESTENNISSKRQTNSPKTLAIAEDLNVALSKNHSNGKIKRRKTITQAHSTFGIIRSFASIKAAASSAEYININFASAI